MPPQIVEVTIDIDEVPPQLVQHDLGSGTPRRPPVSSLAMTLDASLVMFVMKLAPSATHRRTRSGKTVSSQITLPKDAPG